MSTARSSCLVVAAFGCAAECTALNRRSCKPVQDDAPDPQTLGLKRSLACNHMVAQSPWKANIPLIWRIEGRIPDHPETALARQVPRLHPPPLDLHSAAEHACGSHSAWCSTFQALSSSWTRGPSQRLLRFPSCHTWKRIPSWMIWTLCTECKLLTLAAVLEFWPYLQKRALGAKREPQNPPLRSRWAETRPSRIAEWHGGGTSTLIQVQQWSPGGGETHRPLQAQFQS